MITLYDFQTLDIHGRADAVWQGTYLGDRVAGDLTLQLFNLGTFYAEISYNKELNQIVAIRGFKNTSIIEPYLKSIRLTFEDLSK